MLSFFQGTPFANVLALKNTSAGYVIPKLEDTFFMLAKLAYFTCSKDDRDWYHEIFNGRQFDIQICCLTLFSIIKENNRDVEGYSYINTELRKCNRYRSRENLCTYAALFGHIHCLKFAYQNGCPMEEMTCSVAAQQGYLDCLVYAHENGCLWSFEEMCKSYEILSRPGCQFDECREYVKSRIDKLIHLDKSLCII